MGAVSPIKLLPCPFCGGEAEITRYGDRRVSTQYTCTECGCFKETGEEWNHGADWNRRHTMTDQPIKGYRNLSDEEIIAINTIKQKASEIGELVESLKQRAGADQRWVSIGATDLQKGFMALTRAVAKPEGF